MRLQLALTDSQTVERSQSARIRDSVDLSLKPLTERVDCAPHICSILSSLGQFTHPELLTGSNKFACTFCNRKAKKRTPSNGNDWSSLFTLLAVEKIIHGY